MSSIPPNIIGSIFQAQLSAAESAKETDAQRNKRTRDALELARLAEQQTHEVEDADQAEGLRVKREDERQRNGQDAHDTYEEHKENQPDKIYSPEEVAADEIAPTPPPEENPDPDDENDPPEHIDLSA